VDREQVDGDEVMAGGTGWVAERLLAWYERQRRNLPWRQQPQPYAVWVAETMLVQTQVQTMLPYYQRFLERFPTVEALASAPLEAVLRLWEGLGYYARARHLHRAAQQVVREYGGRWPDREEEWRRLPGVGRYMAGAMLSVAFGQDRPAVDGNVRRVLSRLFAIVDNPKLPATTERLWRLAGALLPPGRAGDFNQALMDLGATVCTPRSPRCPVCPLAEGCRGRASGRPEAYPARLARPAVPHYDVTAGVIWRDGRVLIAQRPRDRLLGGMWEFPGGKVEAGEGLEACLQRELEEELGIEVVIEKPWLTLHHAYTHFRITLYVFIGRYLRGEAEARQVADFRWVTVDELAGFPFGKTDRQIAQALMVENSP